MPRSLHAVRISLHPGIAPGRSRSAGCAAHRGVGIGSDQFGALVRPVDADPVAEAAQALRHSLDKRRRTGRAVTVADDKVRPLSSVVDVHGIAARLHRMAIDMPYRAKARVMRRQQPGERGVVGIVVGLQQVFRHARRERHGIDRHVGKRQPAQHAHAAPGLVAGLHRIRHGAVDQRGIDVVAGTVDVHQPARKACAQQRAAHQRRVREELVDIGVPAGQQSFRRRGQRQCLRMYQPAVRGIHHQRQRRSGRVSQRVRKHHLQNLAGCRCPPWSRYRRACSSSGPRGRRTRRAWCLSQAVGVASLHFLEPRPCGSRCTARSM